MPETEPARPSQVLRVGERIQGDRWWQGVWPAHSVVHRATQLSGTGDELIPKKPSVGEGNGHVEMACSVGPQKVGLVEGSSLE